ncbi:hypothetical protein [Ruminococcus flavefaciens]|uniref:hypothetical protein n=1 Tax=Ruminococcus flavefaciens TaxID=1265 RepID=UPI0026F1C65F|nr:hypothetical protein [Ruminococcus flavefaciens]
MMDYKEMAEIVTREVDAILERKKIRAMRIKKVSLAVSGLCAAVIVGVGAWRISSNIKKPDDSFNNSGIISETETTTSANAVTTVITTTAKAVSTKSSTTAAATKTTAAITTSATAATTIKAIAPTIKTTATVTQQVSTTEKTTSVNIITSSVTATTTATTQKIPSTQPSTMVVTVATTCADMTTMPPNSSVTTTQPFVTTSPSELFNASTATVTVKIKESAITYEKEKSLIPPEEIGDLIDTVRVDAVFPYGSKWILSLKAYKIKDVDPEEAVAVRFANFYDTDDYYLFRNPDYKKEE